MVFPILLGSGKPLFGTRDTLKRLALVEARMVGDGIVILIYRQAEATA
jgi:hypothetical protein